jgi:hypothetical protein
LYVLRPVEGRFVLIGEASVRGAMDGEVVKDEKRCLVVAFHPSYIKSSPSRHTIWRCPVTAPDPIELGDVEPERHLLALAPCFRV